MSDQPVCEVSFRAERVAQRLWVAVEEFIEQRLGEQSFRVIAASVIQNELDQIDLETIEQVSKFTEKESQT